MLREGFPGCEIEVMGYRRVLPLVEGRHYADRGRSIEYGPMAGFFDPKSELDPELAEYFLGFGQIVSYIYDPDGLFGGNLKRIGAKHVLSASPMVDPGGKHAALQLASPLSALALFPDSPSARLHFTPEDNRRGEKLAGGLAEPRIAIHPGSGSEKKNWPPERWAAVARDLLEAGHARSVAVIVGEADGVAERCMRSACAGLPVHFFSGLELLDVALLLSRCALFLGHDSGISHLAACAGARCVLLFGPTDPRVWAPAQQRVLAAPGGDLRGIGAPEVLRAVSEEIDR